MPRKETGVSSDIVQSYCRNSAGECPPSTHHYDWHIYIIPEIRKSGVVRYEKLKRKLGITRVSIPIYVGKCPKGKTSVFNWMSVVDLEKPQW